MSQESIDTATRQLVNNHRTLAIAIQETTMLGKLSANAQEAYLAAQKRMNAAVFDVQKAGEALQAEISKP